MPNSAKTILAIIAVLVVGGVVYYFVSHKASAPAVTSTNQQAAQPTVASIDQKYNISDAAPAGFPSEYAPAEASTNTQYINNDKTFGGIFTIQQPPDKIVAEYVSNYNSNGWSILTNNSDPNGAYLYIANTKTGKQFQVTISLLPNNKGTTVDVEVRK